MPHTVFDTTLLTPVLRLVSLVILRGARFEVVGSLPRDSKCVVIGAPHTSNWDLVLMLATAFAVRTKAFWMGKDAIFKPPFGGLMRWLGGIPIDRGKKNNAVTQAIEVFDSHEYMIMVIPPEGSRSLVKHWKTGFYYVAVGAKVPICLGFLDYSRRRVGFGPTIMPTGDIEADFQQFREFYADKIGLYPELTSPVELPPPKGLEK